MSRPRLLDLFCGAGGASVGYHRAGFDVVGVDNRPQPRYPFEFHQADALTFPLDGFDAIHASPPCQTYSAALRHLTVKGRWDALLEETRTRLSGHLHVIENVPGAPIAHQTALWGLDGIMLCGSMFGLGVECPKGWREVRRHRLFESPVGLTVPGPCRHRHLSINPYNTRSRTAAGLVGSASDRALIRGMGIDWCPDIDQGREAIPPAYTQWVGAELMRAVSVPDAIIRAAFERAIEEDGPEPLRRAMELIEEAGWVWVPRAALVALRDAAGACLAHVPDVG